jgi:hypothetical protein
VDENCSGAQIIVYSSRKRAQLSRFSPLDGAGTRGSRKGGVVTLEGRRMSVKASST